VVDHVGGRLRSVAHVTADVATATHGNIFRGFKTKAWNSTQRRVEDPN